MTSAHKVYEGTTYVSHKVTPVPLRHSPTKRWHVAITTIAPEGMTNLPVTADFDIPVTLPKRSYEKNVDSFIAGMKSAWERRTSTSTDWLADIKSDLMKAVNAG